jgi:hypothetical protein
VVYAENGNVGMLIGYFLCFVVEMLLFTFLLGVLYYVCCNFCSVLLQFFFCFEFFVCEAGTHALHCSNRVCETNFIANYVCYLQPDEDAISFASRVKRAIAEQGGLIDMEWDGQLKRERVSDKMRARQQVCLDCFVLCYFILLFRSYIRHD